MLKLYYILTLSFILVVFSFCSTVKNDQANLQVSDSFDDYLLPEQTQTKEGEKAEEKPEEKVSNSSNENKESNQAKEVITEARVEGITFKFDSDKLQLKKHGKILKQLEVDIKDLKPIGLEIEGHTDERGSDVYNMDLGKRRAISMQKFIKDKTGFESEAISYGKRKLLVKNASKLKTKQEREAAHEKNRRVVVVAKFDY